MNEYLYIYDGDDTYLNSKYHYSHNLAVRIYDQLVELLKDSKVNSKLNYTVHFKPGSETLSRDTDDPLGWLITHGYQSEADEIISRQLIFALISDMCHFIFQSLMSAKKMKLTVAFHLLRKPFLENLLIIEQLLVNEKDFLKRFDIDPSKFDPMQIKDSEKLEIIKQAIGKVHKNLVLESNLIFDLRFNKSNANSLYANTNLATHLVTTRYASFSTEKQNLNFIFSSFEAWETQLEYIYYWVPYLMLYTVELIDEFLFRKRIITLKNFHHRKFYRLIGIMLHFDQFDTKSPQGRSNVSAIFKGLKIECKACKKKNELFISDLYSFIHHDYILCKYCLIDLKFTKSLDPLIKGLMSKA